MGTRCWWARALPQRDARRVAVARREDHASVGACLCEALCEVGTAHSRHDDVDDEDVDVFGMLFADSQGEIAATRRQDFVAFVLECHLGERQDALLVVHDEDRRGLRFGRSGFWHGRSIALLT